MSPRPTVIEALLGVVVLACWLGVVGMLRMRRPLQAMHYLTLPATAGMLALLIAMHFDNNSSPLTFQTALGAFILLAANSVVTHATGRAFRAGDFGHWEPRVGDPIEWVHKGTPSWQTTEIER